MNISVIMSLIILLVVSLLSPSAVADSFGGHGAVFAKIRIPAGTTITAAYLEERNLGDYLATEDGPYHDIYEVIGRRTAQEIPAGDIINGQSLIALSTYEKQQRAAAAKLREEARVNAWYKPIDDRIRQEAALLRQAEGGTDSLEVCRHLGKLARLYEDRQRPDLAERYIVAELRRLEAIPLTKHKIGDMQKHCYSSYATILYLNGKKKESDYYRAKSDAMHWPYGLTRNSD